MHSSQVCYSVAQNIYDKIGQVAMKVDLWIYNVLHQLNCDSAKNCIDSIFLCIVYDLQRCTNCVNFD